MAYAIYFASQPTGINTAYRPYEYQVWVSRVTATDDEVALVTAEISADGVVVAQLNVTRPSLVSVVGPDEFKRFDFDISRTLRGLMSYDTAPIDGTAQQHNDNHDLEIEVVFSFWTINSDGLRELQGSPNLTSATTWAVNAGLPVDVSDVSGYVVPAAILTNRPFLSERETGRSKLGENQYLTYLCESAVTNFARVVATDKAGGTTSDFFSLGVLGADQVHRSVPCGAANINAVSTWVGAGVIIDENTAFYTVEVGVVTVGFNPQTVAYRFDMSCRGKYPVQFLSNIGAIEFWNFPNKREFTSQSSAVTRKPRNFGAGSADYEYRRINERAEKNIIVIDEEITQTFSDWLAQNLANTEIAFTQREDASASPALFALRVKDSRVNSRDTETPLLDVEFQIAESVATQTVEI